MRLTTILINIWTALLVCEGVAALPFNSTPQDLTKRARTSEHAPTSINHQMKRGILKLLSSHSKDEPVLGREIVNLGAKADASAEDLLKGFQPLGSFKKLPEGYIGVTTVIGNDGSRQVEYSPERLGKQINYRLTSNSDGHYVLEWRQNDWPKGPASDWQILKTGGKGTASAEKSAVKALLKTDETPKVDQLKRVFTSMRDVHGSGDHYFQT